MLSPTHFLALGLQPIQSLRGARQVCEGLEGAGASGGPRRGPPAQLLGVHTQTHSHTRTLQWPKTATQADTLTGVGPRQTHPTPKDTAPEPRTGHRCARGRHPQTHSGPNEGGHAHRRAQASTGHRCAPTDTTAGRRVGGRPDSRGLTHGHDGGPAHTRSGTRIRLLSPFRPEPPLHSPQSLPCPSPPSVRTPLTSPGRESVRAPGAG